MYCACMKLTLNIDDNLLDRVKDSTGAKTKTEAIHLALNEMDRRAKLIAILAEDIDMTPADWRNAFDDNAVVEDDSLSARVAEIPSAHERKPRPRR